jgi:hypothetical protein
MIKQTHAKWRRNLHARQAADSRVFFEPANVWQLIQEARSGPYADYFRVDPPRRSRHWGMRQLTSQCGHPPGNRILNTQLRFWSPVSCSQRESNEAEPGRLSLYIVAAMFPFEVETSDQGPSSSTCPLTAFGRT